MNPPQDKNQVYECGHSKLHHFPNKVKNKTTPNYKKGNFPRFCDVKYCKCKGYLK